MAIWSPSVRGVVPGSDPNIAAIELTYHGPTAQLAALASGDMRSQVGLKLRAEDSCNLVYVMWRLEPTPAIAVQVKRNAGQTRHEQCGTAGYARVRPAEQHTPPRLIPDSSHRLAATIDGVELTVWADHELVWRGTLPASAGDLHGAAGFRTDNVALDLAMHAHQIRGRDPAAAPCSAEH